MPLSDLLPHARAAFSFPTVHAPALAAWLVLTVLVWLLAFWTWRLLDPGAAGIGGRVTPTQPSRVLAERVATHGLFSRSGAFVTTNAIHEDLLPAPANIVLRGVYAPRSGQGGFAILEIDGRAVAALVGQEAAHGIVLEATRDDHVILVRSGERMRVPLAVAVRATEAAVGVAPEVQLRLQSLGEAHYGLSRTAFNEASKNPASYATFGRFALHPRGGVVLEHSPTDGLSQQLGLQVGDVLTHINQRPLRGVDDAAHLFNHIASGDRVTLNVLRQQRPLTITIEIQP